MRKHVRLICWSLLAAIVGAAECRLLSFDGNNYSGDLVYRRQVERMLGGHLSFGTDPTQLTWDLAWNKGTVQEVWGLGVPLWRLPFEFLARCTENVVFPDRVAFVLAYALMGLLVFEFHESLTRTRPLEWQFSYSCLAPTVLFPPLLMLCRSRFLVYEEGAAYSFLVGTTLLFAAWALWLDPCLLKSLCIALFAGLSALFRPPVLAYGVVAGIIASAAVWDKRRPLLAATVLGAFIAGLALVCITNRIRFGSYFEFGYALNLNSSATMNYASRFGSPFATERLTSAFRELFGLLFCSSGWRELRGDHLAVEASSLLSTTFRWREMYFRTYDLSHFGVILAVVVVVVRSAFRTFKRRAQLLDRFLAFAAGSLFVPMFLLGAFYIRFPFVSSRYLLDFGPALAAAQYLALFGLADFILSSKRRRFGKVLMTVFVLGWWTWEMWAGGLASGNMSMNKRGVASAMRQGWSIAPWFIPEAYTSGFPFRATALPFNGTGWSTNGQTRACVVLYIDNPDCLVLDLNSLNGQSNFPADYDSIQARLGLEILQRESIRRTHDGIRIVFNGPRVVQYSLGVQRVAIAMMSPQDLNTGYSKFRLLKVSWHRNQVVEAP